MHKPAMDSGCLGKKEVQWQSNQLEPILSLELHTCDSSICEVEGGGSEMGPIGRSLNHGRVPSKGNADSGLFIFCLCFLGHDVSRFALLCAPPMMYCSAQAESKSQPIKGNLQNREPQKASLYMSIILAFATVMERWQTHLACFCSSSEKEKSRKQYRWLRTKSLKSHKRKKILSTAMSIFLKSQMLMGAGQYKLHCDFSHW